MARPHEVDAALASPVLTVPALMPPAGQPVGPARALQARMARFSNGPQHTRRRALLEQVLPEVAGLQAAASRHTTAMAQDRVGPWDVMPLARSVPALTLTGALGVPAAQARRAADLVGRLSDALAPAIAPLPPQPAGDPAAEELTALLAPLGAYDPERVAAVAGLLFQARDATAALIGAALLDVGQATEPDPDAAVVERALRQAAPVQCTRRTPTEDLQLGDVTVPRAAPVWLVLAAAERGAPHEPATFGAGPHACPGAQHAIALATGVLTGLRAAGSRPVPGQPVRLEPRPNLRMPATVLVARP